MDLRFPELVGGPVQGLNDAGVENFQGSIDTYLSRECGQNTGDANRPDISTVRLAFSKIDVRASDIPGFAGLRSTLVACLARWGNKDKEREFFEQALEMANQDSIPVLKISDFGTTGLTGTDDDEIGRWFALVKSQGVSNKGSTAGGSFGIGKSSPFASSRFRTVFYGTRLESGDVALQGVSRLVTHTNVRGRSTQGIGFIGDYDEAGGQGGDPVFRAVRDASRIPSLFRREETGTDIWVIGYRSGDAWRNDLIRSLLSNFWPAIYRGSIEFSVANEIINKENLASLIASFSTQADFDAHHYYASLQSQPARKRLSRVGECELYLGTSNGDLPRKICMARGSGMRIFDYHPRACRVPFSGLFICLDADGNRLLRKLEPPKHDTWDPKRVEDNSGKLALDEIKAWIREEVRKLNPYFSGERFNEGELAKYLQDTDQDEDASQPFSESESSREEALEAKPSPRELAVKPTRARPISPKRSGTDSGGLGSEPGPGVSGGEGERGTSNRKRPRSQGGESSENPSPPAIQARSFRRGDTSYEFVLRCATDFSGAIAVRAVGEDGQTHPVAIDFAGILGAVGAKITVSGNRVEGVALPAGVAVRLAVRMREPFRRALVVEATP